MFVHLDTITPIPLKSVDGPKGRFYTIPSGEKYPSITTILGYGEKLWLTEWRDSLGNVNADKEMKRAAERGTAVHLMLERYIQNDPNPTRDQKLEHITEFNSLKMFIKKLNNVIAQETAIYSEILRVAGRVDCIAEYNGILAVIDFKTSSRDKTNDMVQDYYKQATFYALAFEELYGIHINEVVIIMSVEKGAVPLIFKAKVDDHIESLLERINKYYESVGK